MIAYASRTGTRSTLAALRDAGWRLLVSAAGELRTEGFPYALDNGAWSAHQRGVAFDHAAFWRAVYALGGGADFVVLPDIVAGGERSLELTFRAMQRAFNATERVLIAVQDDHEPWQIDELLGPRLGVFVGGTTAWKLASAPRWADCPACGKFFREDDQYGDEPSRTVYDDGTTRAFVDSSGDVWVTKSPFYTRAAFCSPCAPGACSLSSPCDDGERAFCFGHDWFDEDKAPYPVYSVETGERVLSSPEIAERDQMISPHNRIGGGK